MPDLDTTPLEDPSDRAALALDLKKFAWGMPLKEDGNFASPEGYFFIPQHIPGLDFNREIVPPDMNHWFPEGAIGVRVDETFWAVAALPIRYARLSIEDIVKALWPHLAKEAEYLEDQYQLLGHQ